MRVRGPGVRGACVTAALVLLLAPAPVGAQSRPVQRQQQELETLRRQRAALEARMLELRGTAHDLTEEVTNLEKQADATARLVAALDAQLASITAEVDSATAAVERSEVELVEKRAMLRRRLVEIYKRGPLNHVEVMLSSQSFGGLVARYKYLHLLAQRDRALVQRVQDLHNDVARQRSTLVRLRANVHDNLRDRAREEERLRSLEKDRAANLERVMRVAAQTEKRIAKLRADESRMGNLIANAMAAERRRAAAAAARSAPGAGAAPRPAAPASSIRTTDVGQLDWPVHGTILYDFGREQKANNTTIRWNGIGIGAAPGTPVRAVAPGRVLEVAKFGTYGLTVIVEHGGGDYSVYGSLAKADVAKGATIAKGHVVGTVGAADPDMGPHLHFEIRHGGPAVDPKSWLRSQR